MRPNAYTHDEWVSNMERQLREKFSKIQFEDTMSSKDEKYPKKESDTESSNSMFLLIG